MEQKHKKENLKIIPLGGLGEVGRNMMLLEYGKDILIIDAGFRMPGEDMPGIDYIIPNTAYLKEKRKQIRAIVITHGHYDHIGAIPYLMPRIGSVPIYASPLTKGIIQKRQEEFRNQPRLNITTVRNNSKISAGCFNVEFFRQNHNIPDNLGLFIQTPVGNILHTSDFKFDNSPVNDLPSDLQKLKTLASKKILLLLSDSTGAENEGHSLSEKTIFENLEKIFEQAKGRIIASSFASHINRIQQIIALAEKYNRKVIIEGRSMKGNIEISQNLGHMHVEKGTFQRPEQLSKLRDDQVCFICTGAQGEKRATLMKIAQKEYKFLRLKKGDTIVFSSSVIPGNERSVQMLKDQFHRQGAHVFHYQMMDIHTSGHAYQEELIEMIRITHPKFFMPIHGQYSMLVKHKELAEENNIRKENIIVAENGQIINLNPEKISIDKKTVPSNLVMVDGLGVGDVGEIVINDRQALAEDGMFVIVAVINRHTMKVQGSPDIISRGFVYLRESKELLRETRKRVVAIVDGARKSQVAKSQNATYIKDEIRKKIGAFLFSKTRRRPMVLPVVIEV